MRLLLILDRFDEITSKPKNTIIDKIAKTRVKTNEKTGEGILFNL